MGNSGKHPFILGMPAVQAWPEIWDIISPLIAQVMTGGDSVYNEDMLVPIFRNGAIEDVYWTFSYSPVPDEMGGVGGVLVTCNETTQKLKLLQDLQESERRFQLLIGDATVAVIVLGGQQLTVEIVNRAYGKLIDRTVGELIGRPLFDIIPETEAEFRPIINSVLLTGEAVFLYEHPYRVFKNGTEISGFLNLVYQPYKEKEGEISGVMVLCQDVTEQVGTKRLVETAMEHSAFLKHHVVIALSF